jgi:hypothetical protein
MVNIYVKEILKTVRSACVLYCKNCIEIWIFIVVYKNLSSGKSEKRFHGQKILTIPSLFGTVSFEFVRVFNNVTKIVKNFKTVAIFCSRFLESNEPDWSLTSEMPEKNVNLTHMVKGCWLKYLLLTSSSVLITEFCLNLLIPQSFEINVAYNI